MLAPKGFETITCDQPDGSQILGTVAEARTGEGWDGASSTDREKNGTTCATVLQSVRCGTPTGIVLSGDQRVQTDNRTPTE